MTDVSLKRWGTDETFHRYIRVEAVYGKTTNPPVTTGGIDI
jgi:hypothetical protein